MQSWQPSRSTDDIRHRFVTKAQKSRTPMSSTYEPPANITLDGEVLGVFLPRPETRQGACSCHPHAAWRSFSSGREGRADGRDRRRWDGPHSQEAGSPPQKTPEKSPNIFFLEMISQFSKVVGIKVNIQKSIIYLLAVDMWTQKL